MMKNAMEIAINKYLQEPEEVTSSSLQTLKKEFLVLYIHIYIIQIEEQKISIYYFVL